MNSEIPSNAGITLLGLGPGNPDLLTCAARDWLSEVGKVYVQERDTAILQAISPKTEMHVLGDLSFGDHGANPVEQILALGDLAQGGTFVVRGDPLTDDVVCQQVARRAAEEGIPVSVIVGVSLASVALSALGLTSSERYQIISASELLQYHVPPFPASTNVLITNCGSNDILQRMMEVLGAVYPEDQQIRLVQFTETGEVAVEDFQLGNIGSFNIQSMRIEVFLPLLSENRSFEAFQEVIARLRAPDGCPWDRAQTHESLRQYLLEETYEALEALDAQDTAAMTEEFGDVLLQVVLHAQVASELGTFNMGDVLQGINYKLVSRHPHVFADLKVAGVSGVLKTWEEIKAKERKENGAAKDKGLLGSVPLTLPALTQALEYQERAGRVGFDWPDISGVWEKVEEELQEVREAEDDASRAAEIGDLLFAVVNLSRWMNLDAESSLRQTNQRFFKRFQHIERTSKAQGRVLNQMTLEEMDTIWEEAKRMEGDNRNEEGPVPEI